MIAHKNNKNIKIQDNYAPNTIKDINYRYIAKRKSHKL